MPRENYSSLYGSTGLGSRFEIVEDPRRVIPIRPGGMYDSTTPAQLLGLRGSSYYYPSSQLRQSDTPVQSGIQNLLVLDGVANSLGNKSAALTAAITLRLGALGGSFYDAIIDSAAQPPPAFIHTMDFPDGVVKRVLMVNGEVAYQATVAGGTFGAALEFFPTNTGTVDQVTNGSAAIVGAGTNWAAKLLSDAGTVYGAYNSSTPSQNGLRVGDLIRINQGGTFYWHRVASITDNTHITIFPTWQGTTAGPGAGLSHAEARAGYCSYSRIVPIYDSTGDNYYLYYAGGSGTKLTSYGSVQCVRFDSSLNSAHFMGPKTTDTLGTTNVLDTKAVDVAMYKGFLLYGAGSAVSWSVAGFPTSFTTGFGAADFPAANVTVVDNSDFFCSFEFIGDQLVAIFRNSIWLVQPTGSVPEFNFYRMPEALGAQMVNMTGLQVSTLTTRYRPSVSARNSVYYISKEGLSKIVSGVSEPVSAPIAKTASDPLPSTASVSATQLTWEPFSDTVFWHSGSKFALGYRVKDNDWFIQNISSTITGLAGEVRGMTGSVVSSQDGNARQYCVGFWNSTDGFIRYFDQTLGGPQTGNNITTACDWKWQTPIIVLPDTYSEGFVFGGFQLEGRNLTAGTGVAWSMYAGSDPAAMSLYDSGTTTPSAGALPSRAKVGKKCDLPYVGFVLSGPQWVQLVGINVYPAQLMSSSPGR